MSIAQHVATTPGSVSGMAMLDSHDGEKFTKPPALRLLDVPMPSIHGPSADENPFA
jgi:hypothetical protein